MRKRNSKLKLSSETLRTLDGTRLNGIAGGGITLGLECMDHDDTTGGGGGSGGGITVSVPFCPSFYPNTCATIGC